MKRRSMTLIEVMVSMALFSLLVGVICFWYSHFTEQSSKYEKLRKSALAERYFTDRMGRVFLRQPSMLKKDLPPFVLRIMSFFLPLIMDQIKLLNFLILSWASSTWIEKSKPYVLPSGPSRRRAIS